ncbi:MAG: iron ABC transporter permease [Bacteroidota bacterium]
MFQKTTLLVILLVAAMFSGLLIGAYDMSWEKLWLALSGPTEDMSHFLIWNIRIPRVLLAATVGAGLAISGAAIQGLFRNPLADPGIVGITSGAMLFAVLALVFLSTALSTLTDAFQQWTISLFAFIGALLTTLLVYKIGSRKGRVQVASMILAGIAITAFAGAITGYVVYKSDESQLRDITFWTLGSVSGANWVQLSIVGPLVLIGTALIQRDARALNAILLGEKEAAYLGFRVEKVKQRVVVLAALVVGACISVTGLIGFVGLVIPHLLRLAWGTDYRGLLLYSALLGGTFLVLADNLARTIVAPAELPIGILTALIGAPFFVWLLLRSQRQVPML